IFRGKEKERSATAALRIEPTWNVYEPERNWTSAANEGADKCTAKGGSKPIRAGAARSDVLPDCPIRSGRHGDPGVSCAHASLHLHRLRHAVSAVPGSAECVSELHRRAAVRPSLRPVLDHAGGATEGAQQQVPPPRDGAY